MYTIYDYAYSGILYLNNIMRPRHKRLSQLMIYSINKICRVIIVATTNGEKKTWSLHRISY